MADAEASLRTQLAEVNKLERKIQLRLGKLINQLARLEEEIETYNQQIQRRRSFDQEALDAGYLPVEEQYRRVWEVPSKEGETLPSATETSDEKQFKSLYRNLARRYHPDLAADERDREYRTEKMTALNEAYESRSLVEMVALAEASQKHGVAGSGSTEAELIKVLAKELVRVRRRLGLIKNDIENLHNDPVVKLSLDIKLARRSGRDLLGEMAVDLRKQIARKKAERDHLRDQLNQIGH